MGLIAIDKVWSLGFCFGVQGFWSSDFLAFSFLVYNIFDLQISPFCKYVHIHFYFKVETARHLCKMALVQCTV